MSRAASATVVRARARGHLRPEPWTSEASAAGARASGTAVEDEGELGRGGHRRCRRHAEEEREAVEQEPCRREKRWRKTERASGWDKIDGRGPTKREGAIYGSTRVVRNR